MARVASPRIVASPSWVPRSHADLRPRCLIATGLGSLSIPGSWPRRQPWCAMISRDESGRVAHAPANRARRDDSIRHVGRAADVVAVAAVDRPCGQPRAGGCPAAHLPDCLLYTSDAADEEDSVD